MSMTNAAPGHQMEPCLIGDDRAAIPRTLRVLHVLSELHPGGMEQAMLRLVKAIRQMPATAAPVRIEHGFHILKEADRQMLRQCETLGWVQVPAAHDTRQARSARFAFRQLARVLERVQPDVVHARATSSWLDAALAIEHGSLYRRPGLLLSYHGRTSVAPESLWQTMRQAPRRWAARRADVLLAVSHEIAERLTRTWRVDPDRVHVVPNGVDVQSFHPADSTGAKPALRARLGIPNYVRMILCAANFVPIKNHELLIDAFRRVASARSEVHLYLLGGGPCEPAVRYLARDLHQKGGHRRIHFPGHRENIAAWLRAADIFALPSLSEGCSNAVLEAMASGLPVAVSDIPGNREILQHDVTGALLPVNDPFAWSECLTAWLDDPVERRRIGQAARTRSVEHHSLQDTAARYARLYAELASTTSRREVSPCAG